MIRMALVAAFAAATAAECGATDDPPKTAPPPFDWASLDASSVAPTASSSSGPATSDASEARVATLKKLDAALAGGDAKAYAELFATDAMVSVPGVSDWRGRDDIVAMHAKLFHAFDDTKVGSSRVFLKRDRAAVEWVLTGTHARTWLGVSATSKPVAMQALSVYTFNSEGRVSSAHVYFDTLAVMAQMGAMLPSFETGPIAKLPMTTDVVVADGTPDEDANLALDQATAKALEDGNLDALVAPFADDVETFRLGAPTAKGKDAQRKALDPVIKATSDRKVIFDGFGAKGFLVVETSVTSTNTGSLRGAAPTKKALAWRSGAILEMKDKKIVRQWIYSNRAETLSQLGVKFAR